MSTTAKSILKKEGFLYTELDDLFKQIVSEVNECYLAVSHGKSTRFLIIIGGEPYSAAVIDASGRRLTPIQDFFDFCNKLEKFNLEAFSGDKKLLLCMLVGFAYKADQVFSTEVVSIDDALGKIQKAGKDLIMILQPGPNTKRGVGFGIFVKGDLAFVFLPQETGEGSPSHKLLEYCYTLTAGETLSVSIYNKTKVTPADDSGPVTGNITKQFATVETTGTPYLELFEDGRSIGTFDVNGDVTIGRDSTNVIKLPEAGVSREHAVIKKTGSKITVEDLKSANGTSYKNIKIEKKELTHGDEIAIRAYTLKLSIPGHSDEEVEDFSDGPAPENQDLYVDGKLVASASGSSNARLTMSDGTVHKLANITSFGRDDECDIVLDGITFAKRHVTLVKGKNIYKLVKKGGMAAVKVNGEKIEEATLKDGDLIEMGGYSMTFNL